MNNPILSETIKLIDNLKNSKGVLSEKNKALVDILSCSLSLKSIGCNFVINREYGKDKIIITNDNTTTDYHESNKELKASEIANALTCLSLTMSDRAFVLTQNKNNQYMVVCISLQKFPKKFFVREKNSIIEKGIEITNIFDNSKKVVTTTTKKGVREFDTTIDKSTLISNFNALFGDIHYNKALAIVVDSKEKKEKKENIA